MRKYFKYLIVVLLVCLSTGFAFLNGNADERTPATRPWTIPVRGDLFATFNCTIGAINYNFGNVNFQPSVNVTTIKVLQVLAPANIARGATVIISYAIRNTSPSDPASITAGNLRFYKPNTGNVMAGHFTVTPMDAYPFILNGGQTVTLSFQVTPTSTRTTGNYIVDGYITSTRGNDINYTWNSPVTNYGYTAAVTAAITREATSTLDIPAVTICSPNGAIDRIISGGQNFWVSFNVRNLGDSDVIGTRQVQIDWPNSIVQAPAITTRSFTIGQLITFNLTARANSFGTGIVTVSIINTVPIHPIDQATGVTVNYLRRVATMSITVQRPAKLDIIDVYVPTSQVMAYQAGPVTVSVRVRNVGSANAVINVSNANLLFQVAGNNLTSTYIMRTPVPSASMYITSLQYVTVNYVINTFGGGAGICTVNVTLNATDLNSGLVTTNAATAAEVATYNVTANAGVFVGAIRTNKNPIGYLGSFEVYVPVTRISAAGNPYTVRPRLNDLIIRTTTPVGPNVANISFNITAVVPPSYILTGTNTVIVTYSVTVLSTAVGGVYTIDARPGRPFVSDNVTARDVSDPNGGIPTTNVIYDPISPNVVTVTANFISWPVRVTMPTSNFRLHFLFSETMNITTIPIVSFLQSGPAITPFSAGAWDAARISFTSAAFGMSLVTANEGYVTASLVGGVRDVAGNTVVPSTNILRFYVDPRAPYGGVTINNGEAITINPLIRLRSTLSDNYSATPNMMMYITGRTGAPAGWPTSNVSINAGILVNTWIPYNQSITLNLDNATYGTKNIYVRFRDEAGNMSSFYSDNIYLDTTQIIWLYPTGNNIVSNNIRLRAQTSILASYVNFFVSVNNTLRKVRTNVAVNAGTGIATYYWTTANIFPGTTTNAQLIAASLRLGVWSTANANNITFDNTNPQVTINTPADMSYVFGSTVIAGTSIDPANTGVQRVEISTDNGATYSLATGTTAWSFTFNVPTADPSFTFYRVFARVTDLAGNRWTTPVVRTLINFSDPITINVVPTANTYMKNVFTISGNITCPLPIREVRINVPALNVLNLPATGTSNFIFRFSVLAALPNYTSGLTHPFYITAYTNTTPSIVTTVNVPYTIDRTPPNLVVGSTNLGSLTNGIAGTLNIYGRYNDAHSGISNIWMRINAGAWQLINTAGNTSFNYALAVTQPAGSTYQISLRASDNAYITANSSVFSNYTLTVNYGVLPTGAFTSPVSGSYVNNTMTIVGTANMPFTSIRYVYLSFNNGATWVTANGGTNWSYLWTVPPADPHNTVYLPLISVLGNNGIWARPSPDVRSQYIKDIYGPAAVILNLANGMFAPSSPLPILFRTFTEGALVSAAYVVIDGVATRVLPMPAVTQNMFWTYNWDFTSVPGSAHSIVIRAVDTAGNWGQSPTVNIRTIPGRIITEPLPVTGLINGATTITNPIYATSKNIVLFNNFNPANNYTIYVNGGARTPVFTGGNLLVTLNLGVAVEEVKVISIIESDGLHVTANYQPVVYDITRPTINVVFSGVTRYYPQCIIAPNEYFRVNIVDRTTNPAGNYGAGFSATPTFSYVTSNPAIAQRAGVIMRSIYNRGTATDNVITGSTFDPYGELLRFQVDLADGNHYDMVIYAIDNAGNAVVTTFNVFDMIVNDNATGLSGGIDESEFITTYPNPYDPNEDGNVKFTYYLKDNARKTRIFIYNEVAELINVIYVDSAAIAGTSAGYNEVPWNGTDKFHRPLSNGIYLYVLVVEGDKNQSTAKGKMVVLRR